MSEQNKENLDHNSISSALHELVIPDPIRDCKHGRLKRNCDICDMERKIRQLASGIGQPTNPRMLLYIVDGGSRINEGGAYTNTGFITWIDNK